MFKFNFDVEDGDLDTEMDSTPPTAHDRLDVPQDASVEVSLADLLDHLPSLISYSPTVITTPSGRELHLPRRDLFDARFQLISAGTGEEHSDTHPGVNEDAAGRLALDFIDAPSDLVPGVYEGGLKTWECSLDLAGYMDEIRSDLFASHVRGKRVLELGCGSAVPSSYLLHALFSDDSGNHGDTHIHLQDYNRSVLELITFPNIILCWYMSPASALYRTELEAAAEETDALPELDPAVAGELPLSPSLHDAFMASLRERRIHLRFFSGSWETFDLALTGGGYDLVLTSETIYRIDSLDALIGLMHDASIGGAKTGQRQDGDAIAHNPQSMCLVAAKVLYFGVGGGVSDFIRAVESPSHGEATGRQRRGPGNVELVWERKEGVGRQVMSAKWGR